MRQSVLCLLAIAAFCSGQTCSAPLPSPIPSVQGIPDGVYSGTTSQTASVTAWSADGNDVQSLNDSFTLDVAFVGGLPETVEGAPLNVGSTKTVSMGPFVFDSVVHSISVDGDLVVVVKDLVMVMDLGEAARLEVNDTLRAACVWNDFLPSDADVRSFLLLAEADRKAGASKDVQLATMVDVCAYDFPVNWYLPCVTCNTAMIDQVYDELATLQLSGFAKVTYQYLGNGEVSYTSVQDLFSEVIDGEYLRYEDTTTGILSRPG